MFLSATQYGLSVSEVQYERGRKTDKGLTVQPSISVVIRDRHRDRYADMNLSITDAVRLVEGLTQALKVAEDDAAREATNA